MYPLTGALKTAQKKARLSVRQLAQELDMSFSALAKILRGETLTPSVHTDLAIRRFLGVEEGGVGGGKCPCRRCSGLAQGERGSGGESLSQLTQALEEVRGRLAQVEATQSRLTRLLKRSKRKVY